MTAAATAAAGEAVGRRLRGRVAMVTGPAGGLGAAIAHALAREGARVVVADNDPHRAAALARALGPAANGVRLDLREELTWIAAMARVLDEHGRLDVLVNRGSQGCAIDDVTGDAEHAGLDGWHALLRQRLDGVFLGCKHALRTMRRSIATGGGSGAIINVTEEAGLYCRDAVRDLTRGVARYCEAQDLPIRCNAIHAATAGEGIGALAVLLAACGDDDAFNGAEFRVTGARPAAEHARAGAQAAS